MRRIVLTFGLIAGGLLAAMMFFTLPFQEQIGFEKGEIIGYATMVLAFLMVFFGIRSYRDNVAKGSITFGRAFKVGLLITLVATACYVAAWQLVYYKLAPDFTANYAAYAIEKARESGATESEVAEKTRKMEEFQAMYRNPLVNVAITALEPLPVGILFTLVAAGVLSRKRRAPDPAAAR